MAKTKTSFNNKNQPIKRKPRGKAKRTLMLDAIKKVCKNESEFYEKLVSIGVGGLVVVEVDAEGNETKEYKHPNVKLLSMVLDRIEPSLKPISPLVNFKFPKKSPPHIQAASVLDAVANGLIPSDIGNNFINGISSMLKIQEVTDFNERLKKMEDQVESSE